MTFFDARTHDKYVNPEKGLASYFLRFSSGLWSELMPVPNVKTVDHSPENPVGRTHLAFSLGSKKSVNRTTNELGKAGYTTASAPRTTGDGYYESVILDPACNRIEITILFSNKNLKGARYNHR